MRKSEQVLDDLGPLYHEYSFFGVLNEQRPGIYKLNQKSKFPVLLAYIALAIAKSKKTVFDDVTFSELFCADGFYAMVAAKLGCVSSTGIDNDREGFFENASQIAKRLNLKNVNFLKEEITALSNFEKVDVVANVGGLYHVSDPKGILEMSYEMAEKYLIIQTVVNLASEDENYYEAPAPGWTWGNRFSRQSFHKLIEELNYKVVDHHFNELEGNDRAEDKGSVYYLIEK